MLVFLLLYSAPHLGRAQAGASLWTNRYSSPGGFDDVATSIAVDLHDNIYLTGYSVMGFFSTSGYLTVAYSSTGDLIWTNRYDGVTNGADAMAITVDRDGSICVTGESSGTGTRLDYLTLKYSNAGVPLWTNRYNAGTWNMDDSAIAIATDDKGNAYVTGNSVSSSFNVGWATVKYSSSGSCLWVQRYEDGYPWALAIDGQGNVIVTGIATSSSTVWETIKYSPTGSLLWAKIYRGNGDSEARAVVVDGDGNAFVTGFSGADLVTLKYSSDGIPLWTNKYGGSYGRAAAVDSIGDLVVVGSVLDNYGNVKDFVALKYSSSGVPLWTNLYNTPTVAYSAAVGVAIDASNTVVITGNAGGVATTIAYSALGTGIWTNQYPGVPAGLALDHYGNVYVAGTRYGTNNSDYFAVKYSALTPAPVALRYEPHGDALILSWADQRFHLQSSVSATLTFTNIPGAMSPYTNSSLSAQQFFRLIAN